jgi:ATP adenylyltransferase
VVDAPTRVPERVPSGSAPEETGSVFTRLLRSGAPDTETYIVHRGATCFALCNLFPYTSGHLLIVPYREVADLDGLTAAETADLWATVTEAVRVVRAVYRPDGLNVGLNLGRPAGGSVPDHLHVHVVPRWTGDSNFMAAISNTQTLPEALVDTASKLRDGWSGL